MKIDEVRNIKVGGLDTSSDPVIDALIGLNTYNKDYSIDFDVYYKGIESCKNEYNSVFKCHVFDIYEYGNIISQIFVKLDCLEYENKLTSDEAFNKVKEYFVNDKSDECLIDFDICANEEIYENNFNETANYADVYGYTVDEIAASLGKDPSEMSIDDINDWVGN